MDFPDQGLEEGWQVLPPIAKSSGRRRRYRHGSLADLSARSSLPPGPASLDEMFDYPIDITQVLFSNSDYSARCRALLQHGMVEHSDYSGIGAEREAKRLLLQVFREIYGWHVPHVFRKSCDSDPHCQDILQMASHTCDEGSSCVFSDILHQLVPDAQAWCRAAVQDNSTAGSPQNHQRINSEIRSFLLGNSWVVDQDICGLHRPKEHRAHCLVHKKNCIVNKPRDTLPNPGALVIAHAGNCCQAWSQEGKRARASHESQVPLAAWVASRKHLCQAGEEDMFFEECTPLFDVEECLREPLRDTHRIIKVVTGPRLMGWPTSRERLLSAGLSLRSLVWVGPQTDEGVQDEFERLFARSPRVNGSIFLQEDEADVQRWLRLQLQKRSHYPETMPQGEGLFQMLLAPGHLQRLEAYEAFRAEHAGLDGTFFCDLDHWPHSPGPDYGPMMPCLLTHGSILEMSRARFVTPSERFLSLGFHAVRRATERFCWDLGPYVLGQADRHTKSQSGNSQSLPVILAWNLYVFCNTVKRETTSPGPRISNLSDDSVGSDDEVPMSLEA
ncbi:unnamed protein product [Symbiodinium sp. CCMP2592]|nr:unnamed protein product [Symbiodinium sp. CCMP2592]